MKRMFTLTALAATIAALCAGPAWAIPVTIDTGGYFCLNGVKTIMKGIEEERSTLSDTQAHALAHRLINDGTNLVVVYYDMKPERNYHQHDYFYQCMQDHGIWIAQHFGTLKKETAGAFNNTGGVPGTDPDEAWFQARMVDLRAITAQAAHHTNILFWWMGGEFTEPNVTYTSSIIRNHVQRYRDSLKLKYDVTSKRPFTVSHHWAEAFFDPAKPFINYSDLTDFTWFTIASHFHLGDFVSAGPFDWNPVFPEVSEGLLAMYLPKAVSLNNGKAIFMGGMYGNAYGTLEPCIASNQDMMLLAKWLYICGNRYSGYSAYHLDQWSGNNMPHALYTWSGSAWTPTVAGLTQRRINNYSVLVSAPLIGSLVIANRAYDLKVVVSDAAASIVKKVEYFYNGVSVGFSTTSPYVVNANLPPAKISYPVIVARAYNASGSVIGSDTITVVTGVNTYYNKLNVGNSVSVLDPLTGVAKTCQLVNISVSGGIRYAAVSVGGDVRTVNVGEMQKVPNTGLFIYVATTFDGTERFAELMIAPYQYPSVDILCPENNQSTNSNIVKVATNYCGKNVPWCGIGNPPISAENLKTLSFNGSAGQTAETYAWTLSGANGPRTMTVNLTDKLGATVSKSVTVNYNSSLPFYITRGPLGEAWNGMNYYCYKPRSDRVAVWHNLWDGSDPYDHHIGGGSGLVFSRQEVIDYIAGDMAYAITRMEPPTIPAGAVMIWVADKNQYNSGTLNAADYGTVSWKEIYQRLAAMLGKDNYGKYRVWASTSAATRSSLDAIPCLDMHPLAGPSFTNILANQVTVNWGNAAGNNGYQVQRGLGQSPASWSNVGPRLAADTTRYTDNTVSPATTYSYRVISYACPTCADTTGLASVVTTMNVDGVINGNFESTGGWTASAGWNYCGTEYWSSAATIQAVGDAAHHYYGYAYGSTGCSSWITSTVSNSSIKVPLDADSLKFDAWGIYWPLPGESSSSSDVYVTFGSLSWHNFTTASWQQFSYAIPVSYRGTTVALTAVATAFPQSSARIGIDNVTIKSTLPTAGITAPANGSYVPTGIATTITDTSSDLAGINRVEFYVDGTAIGQDFTSPYTCAWTPTIAKTYTLTAKAYDMTGNSKMATSTVTATGIVGYWKLDASTGTIATDNSGNNNNGTLVNGPSWTAGQVNNALSFDGVDDYVGKDAGVNGIGGTPQMTYSVWIKRDRTGVDEVIYSMGNEVIYSMNDYRFYKHQTLGVLPDNTIRADFGNVNNHVYRVLITSNKLTDVTNWHHIAATYDAGTIKVYVDGVEWTGAYRGSWTGVVVADNQYLRLGAFWNGGNTCCFKGKIDDVRIYNRALSAADVLSLYNSQKTGYTTAATTYSWVTASTATGMTGANKTVSLTLPFSFKYYGTAYSSVNVCSNGFLSFTSTSTSSSPVTIPNTAVPNALVAPFWRSLYVTGSGSITYSSTPDAFVVSWNSVRNLMNTSVQSFQVILRNTGEIDYQYKSTTADKPTVCGIEDQAGSQGLATSSTPANSTAIRFRPNELNFKSAELPEADVQEVNPALPVIPTNTSVMSCAPNPSTGQTTINFQLSKSAQTSIKVYNINGQVVKTLINECLRPGYHSVKWDGKDANGNKVAAGVYLYRMVAGDYSVTRKLTVLR